MTPAVIAGLAAGSAAVLRAPFFGALFAALLSGSAAGTIPLAILSAVIGCLIALCLYCQRGARDGWRRRLRENISNLGVPGTGTGSCGE